MVSGMDRADTCSLAVGAESTCKEPSTECHISRLSTKDWFEFQGEAASLVSWYTKVFKSWVNEGHVQATNVKIAVNPGVYRQQNRWQTVYAGT